MQKPIEMKKIEPCDNFDTEEYETPNEVIDLEPISSASDSRDADDPISSQSLPTEFQQYSIDSTFDSIFSVKDKSFREIQFLDFDIKEAPLFNDESEYWTYTVGYSLFLEFRSGLINIKWRNGIIIYRRASR